MSKEQDLLIRVLRQATQDDRFFPGDKAAYVIGPNLYEDIKEHLGAEPDE